jgi:hypothetical protein
MFGIEDLREAGKVPVDNELWRTADGRIIYSNRCLVPALRVSIRQTLDGDSANFQPFPFSSRFMQMYHGK